MCQTQNTVKLTFRKESEKTRVLSTQLLKVIQIQNKKGYIGLCPNFKEIEKRKFTWRICSTKANKKNKQDNFPILNIFAFF